MGSSVAGFTRFVRNVGRGLRSDPEKALLPGGGLAAGFSESEKEVQKQKKRTAEARARGEAQAAEEARKKAVAEESTRKQAEKARKRTIFAGADIEKQTLRRKLGAGLGTTKLGV